jgi:hypothetical protein
MALRAVGLAAMIVPKLTVDKSLEVHCIAQNDFLNLCWAACVKMAATQQKLQTVGILGIANSFLKCKPTEVCDQACDPTKVVNAFIDNRLSKSRCDGPVGSDSLVKQVESGNTVAIGWEGKPNHMALIVGYQADDKSNLVFLVCDPAVAGGPNPMSFEEIEQNYSAGGGAPRDWKETWLDLRR